MIRELDEERIRQGLTKRQLAEKCGMLDTSVRRLFSAKYPDVKLSTLKKIASVLGATIEIKKVDDGLDTEQSDDLIAKLRRVRMAERIAGKTGHDASDVEHALYNLTLTPTERLERRLGRG